MRNTIYYDWKNVVPTESQLEKVIWANIAQLEPLLIGDLGYYSENAQAQTGSLKIIAIKLRNNDNYSMTYSYQWAVFNGCLDINTQEQSEQTVTFTVHPQGLTFDIIEASRPSTADEL